jgi:hypothetical protein
MSTTFKQVPAVMNLLIKSGDEVSTDIDFGTNLSGYTASSQLYSLVDRRKVYDIPTSVTNATAGSVRLSFLEGHTSGVPAGTYGWSHKWVQPGGITKTVLSGIAEILR